MPNHHIAPSGANVIIEGSGGRTAADEEGVLRAVQGRLMRRFPTIDPDLIDLRVHEAVLHFEGARIRDFVPLFVEREARLLLGG